MTSGQYAIRGGQQGRERLRVLAGVLEPTTSRLLDRVRLAPSARCLDVGCGGADVTALIAARVPDGRVVGTDVDAEKLDLAASCVPDNVELRLEDIATTCASAETFDLVYCRFVLSHLGRPLAWVGRLAGLVAPGGALVVEDTDISGSICCPPSASFERALDIYRRTVRAGGGDPDVGPSLPGCLARVGLVDLGVEVVQPTALRGDAKCIQRLTLAAIRDRAVAAGVSDDDEIDRLLDDLGVLVGRDDTLVSTARIVQTWGRRPTDDGVSRSRR